MEDRKEIMLDRIQEERLKLNKVVSFINSEEKEFSISKEEEAMMFDTLLTSLGIEFERIETKKRIIFQLV